MTLGVFFMSIYILIRLNHVIRGKSHDAWIRGKSRDAWIRGKSCDAWHASSECVLYLASRLPMLMLPCSQPAALAATTPAGRAGVG